MYFFRILGEGLKHEAGLKALMGETKSQQQRRLQERLERLRQQKASGEQVDEAEMSALEQVAAGDVDAVDADVLNMLTDELLKDEENATTGSLLHDLQVSCHGRHPARMRNALVYPLIFGQVLCGSKLRQIVRVASILGQRSFFFSSP